MVNPGRPSSTRIVLKDCGTKTQIFLQMFDRYHGSDRPSSTGSSTFDNLYGLAIIVSSLSHSRILHGEQQ